MTVIRVVVDLFLGIGMVALGLIVNIGIGFLMVVPFLIKKKKEKNNAIKH